MLCAMIWNDLFYYCREGPHKSWLGQNVFDISGYKYLSTNLVGGYVGGCSKNVADFQNLSDKRK